MIMSVRTVAIEMVEEARAVAGEIDEFQKSALRSQIEAAQDRMNRLQRLLYRVQTETDAWSERKAV
jgi:hypothetical protein